MRLVIPPHSVSESLRPMLDLLAEYYPIMVADRAPAADELAVALVPGAPAGSLEVTVDGRQATVAYDQPAQACRGIGTLLAGIVTAGPAYREQTPFGTVGIMLDCSRNAVMTVAHFQQWLRQLALMGYNLAMLYTEDTYELPGEDYFGYLRGRYSAAELREIEAYATRLGIEMIGCIQTLGHLEQMLKWSSYRPIKDTSSVMLVGENKTYDLIEKMIAQFAGIFRSRRIHIGMDETHDLGRGTYMDRHGHKRGFDLFNEHLQRVTAICQKHGLQPMIWSDMYFRMGSKTLDYYDTNCSIPDDVKRQIPRAAQLVYWDYYHKDKAFYADWIERHRALGFEPIMASGVWTWAHLWYNRAITEATVNPCVDACREAGLKEILFTLWGDDGAYCEFDSSLAGLTYAAERVYAGETTASARIAARFAAVCGADYEAVLTAASMNEFFNPVPLLWDDPLLRIAWTNERLKASNNWPKLDAHFAKLCRRLRPHRETVEPVDLAHALGILTFFRRKIRLNQTLDAAYPTRDTAGLTQALTQVKSTVRALDQLHASFRRQWHRRNKPFGFDTIQVRLGAQKQRYQELALRLRELVADPSREIPEFEQRPTQPLPSTPGGWRQLAAAGII